jgi:hypothetical protein
VQREAALDRAVRQVAAALVRPAAPPVQVQAVGSVPAARQAAMVDRAGRRAPAEAPAVAAMVARVGVQVAIPVRAGRRGALAEAPAVAAIVARVAIQAAIPARPRRAAIHLPVARARYKDARERAATHPCFCSD